MIKPSLTLTVEVASMAQGVDTLHIKKGVDLWGIVRWFKDKEEFELRLGNWYTYHKTMQDLCAWVRHCLSEAYRDVDIVQKTGDLCYK